ncbi:DUF6710 family protein [Paraburkholderia sp. GAS348]|uniref:DUF6710 family protein n=1 Tax=Paraburkholderia sp. GAS348 TaxID=3035132 RepID=UPI003D2432B5
MTKCVGELGAVDPQTIGMGPIERWSFKLLRWLKAQKRTKRKSPFENIMDMARAIADQNPEALHDLVKLVLRPVQAAAMIGVVENAAHEAPGNIEGPTFFFEDRNFYESEPYEFELPKDQFRVRLATDVVLPWPWNRQRIANALAGIGNGKSSGPWKQDFANHHLSLWLPWGIAFVGGGNHSLTAGIVAGEGELVPEVVYDMSALLSRVRCDGQYFRDTETGRVIARVIDPRIAAVFEIGRLMQSRGVVPNRRGTARFEPVLDVI